MILPTVSSDCTVNSNEYFPDIDFYEDAVSNTFGKIGKGGKYKPSSDFRFDFTAKVTGKGITGYLIDVYPAKYEEDNTASDELL